jgi:hypothetical protein
MNERGAVLVTVLALLLVLTVLAIGCVRTAALDLTMTSYAQFHEQAFRLAQSGIGASLAHLEHDGPAALPDAPCDAMPDWGPAVLVSEAGGSYEVRACRAGSTVDYPGSPPGPYIQRHYRLDSHGRAGRGSEAVVTQGFYVSVLDPSQPPPAGAQTGPLVCIGVDCYLVTERLVTQTYWGQEQTL